MAYLDKILGAPAVPLGVAKTIKKLLGAPLHYGYHCTNIKLQNLRGTQVHFLRHLRAIFGVPLPYTAFWVSGRCQGYFQARAVGFRAKFQNFYLLLPHKYTEIEVFYFN